jgi:phage-related protein
MKVPLKPLYWLGSSLKDLKGMPEEVRDSFGHALYLAQAGDRHQSAKTLKGFSGAGVIEVVADYTNSTYRAVYTIEYKNAVYVLHVFQKKSKSGIATPQQEIELIKNRLKLAHEIEKRKG